jgi:hypothetical protein
MAHAAVTAGRLGRPRATLVPGVIDHLGFDLEFRRLVRVLDLLFVSRNRTTDR